MEALSPYSALNAKPSVSAQDTSTSVKEKDAEKWGMAKKFEAAFISQMLTYTGFAEALTKSGGEDVAGFSQFYMESIAEDITKNGGFGLAEQIYAHMEKRGGNNDDLGRM